ncbi:NEDD4-binding protein 2-like 1 [Durusdinium trenchii]|uniref:NEDD4-binding protein 2-like 1 n=1 Tax=Durusdinium trenchii TaxID=1381693 RepID=A0ABP0KIU9_9DINO
MSYSRAWPTTCGTPSVPAAGHSQMQMGQSVQAQNVQPVMCQPVQPWRQNKESQPYNVLDMHEVTNAVESLYMDELKPYGRILRKRLAERAASMGFTNLDVDIKRLKSVCDTCPWIYVQAEEGGDWSALLCSRSMSSFVDVYSPQDFYPQKMWQAAEMYFESLDDAHMVLPGGRYSCAQALVSRGLDFLKGRSLGQVCHIVQLAISQKKLLGYLNGAVVPYKRSQSMIKERCAEKQRPCTNTTSTIPLSNVKRLFRSRYHTELSETALGHSKLSELLQDPRLKDICRMTNVSHVPHSNFGLQPHLSVAAAGAAAASTTIAAACRAADPQPSYQSKQFYTGPQPTNDRPTLRDRARFVQPLSMEDVEAEAPSRAVQPHQSWRPSSPTRSLRDRWESSHQIGLVADEAPNHVPGMVPESTPHPLMPPTPDTPGFPKWPMLTPNQMDGMGISVQNTFLNYNIPATPCQGRSQSLPRNALRTGDEPDLSKSEGVGGVAPANRLIAAAHAAVADPMPGQKAPMAGYTQSYSSSSSGPNGLDPMFRQDKPRFDAAEPQQTWSDQAGQQDTMCHRATYRHVALQTERLHGAVCAEGPSGLWEEHRGAAISTVCRAFICSTDDYFTELDEEGGASYDFDPSCLREFHEKNRKRCLDAMELSRSPLFVDNTNMALWEMSGYVALAEEHAYAVMIIGPEQLGPGALDLQTLQLRCAQDDRAAGKEIPVTTLERMIHRYEKLPDDLQGRLCCATELSIVRDARAVPRYRYAGLDVETSALEALSDLDLGPFFWEGTDLSSSSARHLAAARASGLWRLPERLHVTVLYFGKESKRPEAEKLVGMTFPVKVTGLVFVRGGGLLCATCAFEAEDHSSLAAVAGEDWCPHITLLFSGAWRPKNSNDLLKALQALAILPSSSPKIASEVEETQLDPASPEGPDDEARADVPPNTILPHSNGSMQVFSNTRLLDETIDLCALQLSEPLELGPCEFKLF